MGLATAQLLASRGAIISLADLNEAAVHSSASALEGGDIHLATACDVRDSKSVDSWIERTVQKLGRLDGAVNMAGVITHGAPVTETTDEMWDYNLAVNARGVFSCIRAQLRAMTPGGSIVSIQQRN